MKIVVVGGGSSGWITASYLKNNLNCDLTVIHSKINQTIGVGEGTTPTINNVMSHIENWKSSCNAVKKYGVLFENFYKQDSQWWHIFEDAFFKNGKDSVEEILKTSCNSYHFNAYHGDMINYAFNQDHSFVPVKSPGYGYHVQAEKLGNVLKESMSEYTLIEEDVKDVIINDEGIDYLLLENNKKIKADYFFDCTGFKRVLIDKLTEFQPYDDMIADSFIVGQLKQRKNRPYTLSSAKEHGWQWEIDTQDRTNSGYVFCSSITSEEDARIESGLDGDLRKFSSGRMKHLAIKNVIPNGLAQSFIEPLEATSIMMTIVTVEKFVETIKRNYNISTFEKIMKKFLSHTKKFVKFHYTLSKRQDSEWWLYWSNQNDDINSFFADSLKNKRYCKPNETLLNHFNIASMMVGYECFN